MAAFVLALFFLQTVDYSAAGMKALEEGKYDAAVEAFRKAIDADPKDYTDHFNLALAYSFLQKDAEGIAEYRKTLELKPGLYEAQLNEGILLMRQKEPVEALALFAAATAQKPDQFRPRYYLAEAQLQTGALAEAEESYRAALQLDPKSANAELGMAHALARQGKLTDADPHFRRAAELDPKLRSYLLELAGLYEEQHQAPAAIAIYREFPDDVAAQEHLGQLMLENKEYAGALPRLEAAYAKDPTPANRAALAAAYIFALQLDRALPLLDKAVGDDPRNYDLRMMYARALRDKRQFKPAADQFYAAAQLKPTERQPWNELGGMLTMMDEQQQALAAFEKAHELGDNSPGNWFLRAIILDKIRRANPSDRKVANAALEAYRQFLQLDNGKNPDQEFQARQRSKIIERELQR